jgi:hypothetical protein
LPRIEAIDLPPFLFEYLTPRQLHIFFLSFFRKIAVISKIGEIPGKEWTGFCNVPLERKGGG